MKINYVPEEEVYDYENMKEWLQEDSHVNFTPVYLVSDFEKARKKLFKQMREIESIEYCDCFEKLFVECFGRTK